MKAFITFLCLMGLLTSCEDTLISVYEEPKEEEVISSPTEKEITITESRSDSTTNEPEQLYPIGFTVNVNDFKEYGDI